MCVYVVNIPSLAVVITISCFRSFHVLFLLGIRREVGNIQNLFNVIVCDSTAAVLSHYTSDFDIGRHSIV